MRFYGKRFFGKPQNDTEIGKPQNDTETSAATIVAAPLILSFVEAYYVGNLKNSHLIVILSGANASLRSRRICNVIVLRTAEQSFVEAYYGGNLIINHLIVILSGANASLRSRRIFNVIVFADNGAERGVLFKTLR